MTDQPDQEPNEIVAVARAAKERSEAAARSVAERAKSWPLGAIGVGVGIGSAAVAAAVIFASRSKGGK
ncbi:MAG TPA: hypothetical protein VF592_08085 [Sphingomonas sp.]|jgi:hypothetical protein|uniref:hypothetical protein n=1 Tax=Sphingomonas sp. TaxID=28214 RepID=UPI002EDB51D7